MGETHGLSHGQQEVVVMLMRALADAELVAEEARCRLCETRSFDPTSAFKCLQGGGGRPNGARGWFNANDLQSWLVGQPHAVAGASYEELAALLLQYGSSPLGELRLEDFHNLVLPRNPANECLKRLALARGAESSWRPAGEVQQMSPEAASRFCQLLEGELQAVSKLRYHRQAIHDQSIHRDSVLRFLDSEQGLCAGMGGLLSQEGFKALVVERLQALSATQADALLRRARVSSAAFFSFEDLAKCLLPPLAKAGRSQGRHSVTFDASADGGAWPSSVDASWSQSFREEGRAQGLDASPWRSGAALDASQWRSGILSGGSASWAPAAPSPASWAPGVGEPVGGASPPRASWTEPVARGASPPRASWTEPVSRGASPPRASWTPSRGDIARTPQWAPTPEYVPGSASPARAASAARALSPRSGLAPVPQLRDVGGPSQLPLTKPPQAARARSPLPGLRGRASPSTATPHDVSMSPATPEVWRGDPEHSPDTEPLARFAHSSFMARSPQQHSGYDSFCSPMRGAGAHGGGRPSSLPPSCRQAWNSSSSSFASPWATQAPPQSAPRASLPLERWEDEARERLTKAVLSAMSKQAALDAEVEEAKALVPPACTPEAVFASLDRARKGYISVADARSLLEDFGGAVSTSEFSAIVREVRLQWSWDDPAASTLLIQERLSLRDVGLLLCPAGSQERAAVREAKSDDELRSALYLLRNSEPCPTCTARVQRDADAAGCPTVTCPICRTAFRCFCVVGDPRGGWDSSAPPLSTAGRFQVSRLLGTFARIAGDAERERKKLSLLASYDSCGLADVFNSLAGAQVGFSLADLRRAFLQHGLPLTERELGLLGQRYGPSRGGGVSMSDFRRQLQPTAAWLTASTSMSMPIS